MQRCSVWQNNNKEQARTPMLSVTTIPELRDFLSSRNTSLGFVPTMGALHAGHISLVERARAENETVVVSIFVNPTQFNDPQDLERYPRTPEADLRMLEDAGADAVFIPSVSEMYPEPDTRVFDFGQLDTVMEGATRPGHFNGVAQVVSRLLELVKPDRVYFGEKDFQQVAVVKDMVRKLALNVEVMVCPTVREPDGLAMSSRNTLLPPEYRAAAPKIYNALKAGVEMMERGLAENSGVKPADVENYVISLINEDPLLDTIYFSLVDSATLKRVGGWHGAEGIQGCVAVQAGKVRLIDNIRFK